MMASCNPEDSSDTDSKEFQPANVDDASHQQVIQGYDYDFVPPLDAKYECAICLMCQRDPVQTSCGHRFCRACIMHWIRNERRRCPEDNCTLTEQDVFADNFAKREICSLKIKCTNTDQGCQAVIELGALEEHRRYCEYEKIACPNGCPAVIRQQDVHEHVTKECLNILIECTLCYAQFHLGQQQSHFETCPLVCIPCRHCGENLPRQDHPKHLHQDCPKAVIPCPFTDIGCDVATHPDLLQEHLVTYVHKHLRHLSTAHNRLQIVVANLVGPPDGAGGLQSPLLNAFENLSVNHQQEKPKNERKVSAVGECHLKEMFQRMVKIEQSHREQEIKLNTLDQKLAEVQTQLTLLREQRWAEAEGRFCNGVYVWRVCGINELAAQAAQSGLSKLLHSPGFYTGAFGYRSCLRLNVTTRQTISYLSLFIHFMQGDYDDTLEWPFRGHITMALIESSRGDRPGNHIIETMATKPGLAAFQRPTSDRNPKGFGYTEFVSMEVVNRGFYLNNDTLTVRAVVAVEPNIQCE